MAYTGQKEKDRYTALNRVKLVRAGHPYFSLLKQLIDDAAHSVYLHFYIFLEDETGAIIIETLKAAAARGVSVFLLVDAYASNPLSKRCIREMREAGVFVKFFEPLLRSRHFYFGRRLHHKVVVSDGLFSLVGGINICNRYNDMPEEPAWLDLAIYCEGEASLVLQNTCRQMWSNKKVSPPAGHRLAQDYFAGMGVEEEVLVRVRRNDWVKRKNEISRTYLEMFSHAEKHITIMCSYFLPGRALRKKLVQAANRGVHVKVILAGRSDVAIAKHAERYLYDWMLKNKIAIYEYQETVLHAKVAVADSRLVTIGSYNINNISAYASLELNMDVKNEHFARLTEQELQEIIDRHCRHITLENYNSSTHFLKRLWQRICYGFINNVLNLFTFYFKQEE
jgi:cardiolipin synthase